MAPCSSWRQSWSAPLVSLPAYGLIRMWRHATVLLG